MVETQLNFEAVHKTIGEIVKNAGIKYRIPRYQRPYAWDKEQMNDFWVDLNDKSGDFFIGSFIFNSEYEQTDGFVEIIDGQQRVLTITILAAVVRDIAEELGDEKYAYKVQREWIMFEDDMQREFTRVHCGDSTREFFEKYVQYKKGDILEATKLSKEEKRVQENYKFLKEQVGETISGCQNVDAKKAFLLNLMSKLSCSKAIWIMIKNDADAYTIFESVNARGVDLSVADLLKNAIFKEVRSEASVDYAKKTWQEIADNIQATEWELTKFIRYYWLSKYAHIPEKKLFKNIKEEFNGKNDYEGFLYDLKEASRIFNLIVVGGEEDFWGEMKDGDQVYRSLAGLRAMGVSQCFVFLMSLFRNQKKMNMNASDLVKAIENFTFAYAAVCKKPGNKVEKLYSTYAIYLEDIINSKDIKKKDKPKKINSIVGKLKGKLKENHPDYDEFEKNFEKISYKSSSKTTVLLAYLLSRINDMYGTNEMVPNFSQVNLEHILPQNPSAEWGLDRDSIKGYVDKLGNLTLLSKKLNKKAGNKSIEEKLKHLEESEFAITRQVVGDIKKNNHKWNEAAINKRQAEFCNRAYNEIWKLN
jgi:sulfur relay (sulfurtransferase) DsrC/TusE family protein